MFEEERAKKPWKKVALAVFLCLAGAIMLTVGIVLWYEGPGEGSGKAEAFHCTTYQYCCI